MCPTTSKALKVLASGEISSSIGLQSSWELKMYLGLLTLIHYKNCSVSWLPNQSQVIDFLREIYQLPEQLTPCTLLSLKFIIWDVWQQCSVQQDAETSVIFFFFPNLKLVYYLNLLLCSFDQLAWVCLMFMLVMSWEFTYCFKGFPSCACSHLAPKHPHLVLKT